MEERIDYKGMTSQPSDYQCGDGDMQVAVNAEFRDGAYHATREPKDIKFEKENFKPLFIHRPNSEVGDIVIGALKSDDKFVIKAYKRSDKEEVKISGNITIDNIDAIGKFQNIGNIITTTINKELSYFVLKYDKYKFVQGNPPSLKLFFAANRKQAYDNKANLDLKSSDMRTYPANKMKIQGGTIYAKQKVKKENERYIPTKDLDENCQKSSNFVFNALNSVIKECEKDNCFIFPILIKYAYRLYDGSHIMSSSPILLFPKRDSVILEGTGSAAGRDTFGNNLAKTSDLYIKYEMYNICYTLYDNGISDIVEKWGDIINSVDIFISKQIYTINTEQICFNSENQNINFEFYDSYKYDDIYNITSFYKLTSISINNFENIISLFNYGTPTTYEDLLKNKYYNILLQQGGSSLENLEQKETLKENVYNRDFICNNQHTYNNRLIISNYERSVVYKGIDWVSQMCPPIIDLINPTIIPDSLKVDSLYGQITYRGNVATADKCYLEIMIDDEKCIFIVVEGMICNYIPVLFTSYINEAKSINIKVANTEDEYVVLYLTKNDYANGTYAFNNIAKKHEATFITPTSYKIMNSYKKIYKNTLIFSEVNNPFLFSDTNTVSIGSDKILSLSNNARATSQGQFGQYPLYAFCTDGVFAISVGNDGTLQSSVPLSYDILTDANSVGNMDTDIVFATRNGIIALNGGERRILLPADKTATYAYDNCPKNHQQVFMQGKDGQSGAIKNIVGISPLQMTNLYDYITNGVRFAYDATHARLIAYNPKYDYSYIMEASSGMWSVFNKGFDSHLSIPEQCLMLRKEDEQFKVYDYSSDEVVVLQKSYLITRPFKLGYPDIHKSIHSIIQRGVFCNINDVQQCVYASNDLYHWFPVWSSTNIYLRGMRGSGYKYYRLVLFIPKFKQEETLQGATFEFAPRLTNQQR